MMEIQNLFHSKTMTSQSDIRVKNRVIQASAKSLEERREGMNKQKELREMNANHSYDKV